MIFGFSVAAGEDEGHKATSNAAASNKRGVVNLMVEFILVGNVNERDACGHQSPKRGKR